MPPKRVRPQVPESDRITRSRSLSAGTASVEQGPPDQEPRPPSRASSTHTLVQDSSELSYWEVSDGSNSDTEFASFIETTSTQNLAHILPDPSTLPPLVPRVYSPSEFDATPFFHSAISMADEDQRVGDGERLQPAPVIPTPEGMPEPLMQMMLFFQQQSVNAATLAEQRYRQQRADDMTRQQLQRDADFARDDANRKA